MADLVGDHVVGQRRVHRCSPLQRRQPAEQHRVVGTRVEGIGLDAGLRDQEQLRISGVPGHGAPEVLFDERESGGCHRKEVLRAELRVRDEVVGGLIRLVGKAVDIPPRLVARMERYWLFRLVGSHGDIDDVEAMAARSALQPARRHLHRGEDRLAVLRHQRILREHRHRHRRLRKQIEAASGSGGINGVGVVGGFGLRGGAG